MAVNRQMIITLSTTGDVADFYKPWNIFEGNHNGILLDVIVPRVFLYDIIDSNSVELTNNVKISALVEDSEGRIVQDGEAHFLDFVQKNEKYAIYTLPENRWPRLFSKFSGNVTLTINVDNLSKIYDDWNIDQTTTTQTVTYDVNKSKFLSDVEPLDPVLAEIMNSRINLIQDMANNALDNSTQALNNSNTAINVANSVRTDADNGKFDGAPGRAHRIIPWGQSANLDNLNQLHGMAEIGDLIISNVYGFTILGISASVGDLIESIGENIGVLVGNIRGADGKSGLNGSDGQRGPGYFTWSNSIPLNNINQIPGVKFGDIILNGTDNNVLILGVNSQPSDLILVTSNTFGIQVGNIRGRPGINGLPGRRGTQIVIYNGNTDITHISELTALGLGFPDSEVRVGDLVFNGGNSNVNILTVSTSPGYFVQILESNFGVMVGKMPSYGGSGGGNGSNPNAIIDILPLSAPNNSNAVRMQISRADGTIETLDIILSPSFLNWDTPDGFGTNNVVRGTRNAAASLIGGALPQTTGIHLFNRTMSDVPVTTTAGNPATLIKCVTARDTANNINIAQDLFLHNSGQIFYRGTENNGTPQAWRRVAMSDEKQDIITAGEHAYIRTNPDGTQSIAFAQEFIDLITELYNRPIGGGSTAVGQLGDAPINTRIHLFANGLFRPFRIVHQGTPQGQYYDGWDGATLLIQDLAFYPTRQFLTLNYLSSNVHLFLRDEYPLIFPEWLRDEIVPGYIPAWNNGAVESVPVKAFAPSTVELGLDTTGQNFPDSIMLGANFGAFQNDASRVIFQSGGGAISYSTRTPRPAFNQIIAINVSGHAANFAINFNQIQRPVIALPKTIKFDKNNILLRPQ